MENIVEILDRTLTEEQRELLLFLYGNLHVDELSEEEQCFFIEYFFNSETLRNMAKFAIAFVEIIREIEENIPAIEREEGLTNSEEQRCYYARKWHEAKQHELKHRIMKKGNVLYVPFADYKKELGPIIVCLEQTKGMSMYAEMCKSMILPLFAIAHQECRDLYIVPYNHHVHVHYRFENGHLNSSDFVDFIECDADGEAAIIPVLQFAKGLLQENQQCADATILMFTEGVPVDGQRLVEPNVKLMVQEMIHQYHVDISVIAMQETNFNEQHFWFANKAFFVDDYLQ